MADIKAEKTTCQVIGLVPNQPEYRILIVEDTLENRVFLYKLLQSVGFTVQEATNGQEAIERFEQWQPHLIFMDLRMPVMDGSEATKRIREYETRNTKHKTRTIIIALTASTFEDARAHALSEGCDDFIHKPVREADIFDAIETHLGVHYLYEEGERQKTKGKRQALKEILTPTALAAVPSELFTSLERAITQLDMKEIARTIEIIKTHNAAVAEALATSAKQYKYREILSALRNVGKQ